MLNNSPGLIIASFLVLIRFIACGRYLYVRVVSKMFDKLNTIGCFDEVVGCWFTKKYGCEYVRESLSVNSFRFTIVV